ncbi:hypothetical protein ADIS_3475 [Lunatimonas lonarensis]|uniref:Uncharacterized protein n=1 Tax=Lunatimonas lonarensis TaxID=1232681 RepID=R7ZQI7_9BACT|nr:hypothetical protein ADIS_3475 [Lunatimonas lonarensis]
MIKKQLRGLLREILKRHLIDESVTWIDVKAKPLDRFQKKFGQKRTQDGPTKPDLSAPNRNAVASRG